ncbi:heavy metal-associated isoprenylated plant protein 30 isoform X2 [Solanum lycopersicum]|uniref:HMA domain-containing protein n=1 Tax=Solanum lycopersicum TaxID=4081 RepID=A0A3Q7J3B3_SOLLC|nr:heavy metal-associated isoprenylated plant protein 30 isoform X2 [Solanum lycopersicum]
MMKINFGKVLDCFSTISSSGSCFCINEYGVHDDDGFEKKPLMNNSLSNQDDEPKLMRLKDVINVGPPTLAFQLKPKIVVLRVSIHCNGCARKVEKHISKMEGVDMYQVDLETKKVVVIGDIIPFQVLESVSKIVKNVELSTWNTPEC